MCQWDNSRPSGSRYPSLILILESENSPQYFYELGQKVDKLLNKSYIATHLSIDKL